MATVYDVTLDDSLVGTGETMTIWGSKVETAIMLDGSGETDGSLKIFGGTTGDTLLGGAGDDWFWGGLGGDTITGGAGADTFYYEAATQSSAGGYDTLVEFDDSVDKIELDGLTVSGFAGALSGTLNAASLATDLEGGAELGRSGDRSVALRHPRQVPVQQALGGVAGPLETCGGGPLEVAGQSPLLEGEDQHGRQGGDPDQRQHQACEDGRPHRLAASALRNGSLTGRRDPSPPGGAGRAA